jgi:hypothetical protein
MAAAIPLVATIGGSVLSAASQKQQGNAAYTAGMSEANQLAAQATNTLAASQRQAMEDRRQSRLLQSKALALSAAGGGGASDVSVVKNISDLEAQGELNALNTLWSGSQQGQQLDFAASNRRKEAAAAKKAGGIGALTSILQTGGSLYSKYGGK